MKTLTSLFALAALLYVTPALAAEDGGNGAVTTRPDSGASKEDVVEDDGCSVSGARTDLTGSGAAFGVAALGAGLVLVRGRRRSR